MTGSAACPYCGRNLVDLGATRLFRLRACNARQHGPFPLVFQADDRTGNVAGEIKTQAVGILARRILDLMEALDERRA